MDLTPSAEEPSASGVAAQTPTPEETPETPQEEDESELEDDGPSTSGMCTRRAKMSPFPSPKPHKHLSTFPSPTPKQCKSLLKKNKITQTGDIKTKTPEVCNICLSSGENGYWVGCDHRQCDYWVPDFSLKLKCNWRQSNSNVRFTDK